MNTLRRFFMLSFLAAILARGEIARAQFTFLGPIPYRSAADSPFNLSGLGTTFFLEDFEDMELNTPGILNAYAGFGLGSSVDGDDGAVDGNGESGHSGVAGPTSCTLTTCGYTALFLFDDENFGRYPSHVGFTVTAANDLGAFIRVYDAAGNSSIWDLSSYSFNSQSVSDDMFFGVVSPIGITEIAIIGVERRLPPPPHGLLRIDHLQYGIPEPGTFTACLISVFLGLHVRR